MWATDEISQLCYECFSELPKRGKPEPGLCFISTVEVVSLGAGTKCIWHLAMSSKGWYTCTAHTYTYTHTFSDTHALTLSHKNTHTQSIDM
uniref:Uncharacterized protein n=1 Tax=Oncorhynchus mykiss TaxID=8022 RepID=A0A8K9VAY4_ONCMY